MVTNTERSPPSGSFQTSQEFERTGDNYFDELRLEEAVLSYYDAIIHAPENIRAHIKLLKVFHLLNDTENLLLGLEYFDAVAPVLDDITTLLLLVDLNREMGRTEEAERQLEIARRLVAENWKTWLNEARRGQQLSVPSTVETAYQSVIRSVPRGGDVHANLLHLMISLGKTDLVERRVREMLRREPLDLVAWQLLDEVLATRTGVKISSSPFTPRYIGERREMVAEAEETLRTDPEDITAHVIMAEHELTEGRWGNARVHLRKIMIRDPDNEYAKEKLEVLRRAVPKWDGGECLTYL